MKNNVLQESVNYNSLYQEKLFDVKDSSIEECCDKTKFSDNIMNSPKTDSADAIDQFSSSATTTEANEKRKKKVSFSDSCEIFKMSESVSSKVYQSADKPINMSENKLYEIRDKSIILKDSFLFRAKRAMKYYKSFTNKSKKTITLIYKSISLLREDVIIMGLEDNREYKKNIFRVSGLKYDVTEALITDHFKPYGDILSVNIVKNSKGFCVGVCTICFKFCKSSLLMDIHKIGNREVFLSKMQHNEVLLADELVSRKVVVKNLEKGISKKKVLKEFKERCMATVFVKVYNKKIYGLEILIEFTHIKDSIKFIKNFNNYKRLFGFGSAAQFID